MQVMDARFSTEAVRSVGYFAAETYTGPVGEKDVTLHGLKWLNIL